MSIGRRKFAGALLRLSGMLAVAAVTSSAIALNSFADDMKKVVKIGYAVSKSGVNAGGAGITTIPNYKLWIHDVKQAGGLLMPDGKRIPIEVIEYDDRSSSEEVVRAVERLATQDEVDFILAPWGTGFNLAVAPLFHRFGYPQLAVSAVTDKAPEFVKRWNKSFWLLGGGHDYAAALANIIKEQSAKGLINKKVAVVSVADGFGIDLIKAARPAFKKAGLDIVYDKAFPIQTSDFATIINEAKATGADSFVAFSYPPHTFAMTKQAKVVNYSPALFYLGVGVGFPVYAQMNGESVDGIMSLGGIDPGNEKNAAYRKYHEEVVGQGPDYWGSVVTYSSLQMLQQAIERVGLDRELVSKELATGTFETAAGTIKLEDNQYRQIWWAGQWQKDKFVGVAPSNRAGASQVMLPKPAWK